nr:MAG TPA: Minor capsid protein [Caudoviricetes sp.]
MTVMQSIQKWLKTYKGLSGRLDVDFLTEKADTYSVDTVPCEEVLKRYHDGSMVKQFQFAVSSRRYYDQNIKQNLSNLQFFEDLTAWVEQMARERRLPVMDNGREALKIVVTSNAYPFIVSEDGKARYQLQMRLEYYQKRRV